MLRKVHVVAGDVSKPELGMKEEDVKCIIEEVSVVYHCAANLSLIKPLRYMVQHNSSGTKPVIDMCRQMKKFCVLVYTSTSYSNCNQDHLTIKEEVYRLLFPAQKFVDAMKYQSDENLLELVSQCKPYWPSAYAFSKCLSEHIIQDMASDLPVAIVRPSIIGPTWKNPFPGYIDEVSTYAISSYSVGEGFVKVLYGDPNKIINLIPVDVVANVHLMAAWSIGAKKLPSPLVINCTSKGFLNSQWIESIKSARRIRQDFHSSKYSQTLKKVMVIKNRFLHWIAVVNEHYIPGLVADIVLILKGGKPRVFATYRVFQKFFLSVGKEQMKSPQCETHNLDYLNSLIHEKDRQILDNNFENISLEEYMKPALQEIPSFDWKRYHEILIQYDWLISIVRYTLLIFCGCLIYCLTMIMFRQLELI